MPILSSFTTGLLRALNDRVSCGVGGYLTCGIRISGSFSGTLTFQGSVDGVTYRTLTVAQFDGISTTTTQTAGQWRVHAEGLAVVAVTMSSYSSGTADVCFHASGGEFGALSVTTGGISTSTLGTPGVQYAPEDTGTLGTGSIPAIAAYAVDTVTQSSAIKDCPTGSTLRITGDVRATYPDTTPVRIYASSGTYGAPTNDGCYVVTGTPTFAAGDTTITLDTVLLDNLQDTFGRLTKGIVATYHIGSPGTTMQVGSYATAAGRIKPTIMAVNQGAKRYTVAGDYSALFTSPFLYATITGSTGNDGNKTLVSATLSAGNTLIVVGEAVSSSVADGTIEVITDTFHTAAGCGHGLTINVTAIV